MKTEPTLDGAVDLSAFLPVDAATLQVVAPGTDRPIGWAIQFAGPSHEKTIAWSNESARETLQRQRKIEMAQVNGRKYKPEEQTVEELRRENVRWVVARIISWTPVKLSPKDEPVAFNEKAAVELLMRPELGWVYAQCLEFLTAESTFTQASASR